MADQETPTMDDSELFASAVADEPEKSEPEVTSERPRDEHGRFVAQDPEGTAPKVEAEAPQTGAVTPPEKPDEDSQVPSWRLREIRQERDTYASRAQEYERNLTAAQEQIRQFHARLQKFENPPKELDPFESPKDFRDQGVREAIDPVQSRIDKIVETFSKRDAIREHGEQVVRDAYQALEQGLASRDPEAHSILQRARSSEDPFGIVVGWHKQKSVFSKIGSDPDAWFEKRLEESWKDPAFAAKALERIQGSASSVGSDGKPAIRMPQSINKTTGAGMASGLPSDGDMSDRGLFRHAVDAPRR